MRHQTKARRSNKGEFFWHISQKAIYKKFHLRCMTEF